MGVLLSMRSIRERCTKLGPGVYVDGRDVHVFPREFMKANGMPDVPAMESCVCQAMREQFRDYRRVIVVAEREQ